MSARPLSRRTLFGAGLSGAAIAVGVPLSGAGPALATSRIIPTATWGARPPSEPITVLATPPNKIIVHHTASANSTDLSRAHAEALARSIQADHMSRGFIDTGQHFTISRGGFTLEGRHRSLEVLQAGGGHVASAHTTGQNDEAVGIENEGTYTTAVPPAALYDQLVALCTDICRAWGFNPREIYGHRDFAATACPGDVLYARLATLRTDVAGRLGVAVDPWPTFGEGARGQHVRTIQHLLRQHGATVTADGAFGPATAAAVRAFQTSRGLTADGVVGPPTWPVLIVTVRNGASGPAVEAVQDQLAARGYGVSVDGRFGPNTEAAVRAFQTDRGLASDGVAGPHTWRALVS
ncbi:peptidoglycan recognition protein family protein [Catenuloplanes atrovinosus]|uniref:N-acetyl-anhydromuramyl-L-alanine amidase AmpD n=1 Tax=Catenuloplanes atrovinosus TaxID=137266 RepID=A0AAE4CAG3_9ACTN|nr:N-acetylmuramoyl-L-alanine amidase [Catenuloplanes atrovinosus]MDR7276927.1 N-acetyl-anhydromuramyl-L-alanine amidase AmpD [Catenuloplanes atrovinosus]